MIVTLERTRIEVPTSRRNARGIQPSYRWAPAYFVFNPLTNSWEQPAYRRKEAYARARELGATKIEVIG